MFSTARLAITLSIVLLPISAATSASSGTSEAQVSLEPSISFVGGAPEAQNTVVHAVARFTSQGLALPDLEIRFHDDAAGCGGHHGLFHHNGGDPFVDLCYDREFLALHELGHVWEHFNLDAAARTEFQQFTGASTWNAADVDHDDRAIEIAAEALAHGLLTAQLTAGMDRDREFAQFEALTGFVTPRLAEMA